MFLLKTKRKQTKTGAGECDLEKRPFCVNIEKDNLKNHAFSPLIIEV